MDIRQLKYFITIAEEGQITAAAKKLWMAQPPLSHQMKLLEDELGVVLFERGPRQIQLTDAGKILFNRARQIIELSDSTIKEIEDFKRGFKGTLNIGTVSSSGNILLNEGIAKFHKEYSGVRFEIHESNTYTLIDLLTRGLIEVGIVRTPFKNALFHCRYAEEEPMAAVMDKKYDWQSGTNIKLEELKGRPLIIYRRFDRLIEDVCAFHGFSPEVFCRTDDARTSILWANAGHGIAVVPASAVTLASHENLRVKIIEEKRLRTQITAIWMKGRYLSLLAEKFINHFTAI
ncbi:LysR family transcriptional regulator [Pectinatus haikarae]|uniref:DNA-binding transcriptional LysR family regulator n=1 Tax=Pectinatus haikarae TaxID=349096 RepID=A0ABT9Y805_9FIRM|nr:LysR family transcriptional regulator [Pectinatus haikarae]MDQ0203279.1 DNA-binding transcriptional LysR family regulator [Pectinatus haikarae]